MRRILMALIIFSLFGFSVLANSKTRSVDREKIEGKDNLIYVIGEKKPYTGEVKSIDEESGGKIVINVLNGDIRTFTHYYPNGKTKAISNLKNGVYEGESKDFYENGKLANKNFYKNGELNGITEGYDENGVLRVKKSFVNDMLNGITTAYDEAGKIKFSGNFKDNRQNGESLAYKNGKLAFRSNYKNDLLDGVTIVYDDKGNVTSKNTYSNNVHVLIETYENPHCQVNCNFSPQ